ncbi:MAG: DUF421 domain-containing protein [Bacteroidetes bacterium]|nr:DUF421 domain-containing protein [Bacteroidota bacterium]
MLNDIGIIIIRSITVYVFIVVAIRIFGKRELSQISVIDLVFILLLSNSVQNAMVGPDSSLLGGLVAAASLFVVNFVLKLFTYKNKKVSELINDEPVLLVHEGKVNQKNLEKEKLTMEELESAIREHSIESVKEVKLAMLEPDGNISIVSKDHQYHISKHRKAHKIISKIE